jgi:ABC-type multidrug transport system ATPase subunit
MAPTEGKTHFTVGKRLLEYESYYQQLSWAAPWQDLYTDLTLAEAIHLHFQFKTPLIPESQIAEALELEKHLHKPLRHFSSGMLHRTKTGLAIFSKSRMLILDEATTNMDQTNADLVFQWLDQYQGDRMLIFASNNPAEFERFDRRLDLGSQPYAYSGSPAGDTGQESLPPQVPLI